MLCLPNSTACQLQQLLFTLMMRMEKYETLNASCATYARAVSACMCG